MLKTGTQESKLFLNTIIMNNYFCPRIVVLLFILVSCFASSCTEENEFTDIQPTSDVDVQYKNGRLTFYSLSSYEKIMNKIIGMNEEEMDAWENSLGFSSYRRMLKNNKKDNTDFPNIVSTLLNENKEYQIGSSLIWIDGNNVYKVPGSNEELLAKIQDSEDKSPFSSYREDFITKTVDIKLNGDESSRTSYFGTKSGRNSQEFAMGTLKYRFRFDHWTIYSGGLYYLQLINYLQYLHHSKGTWLQAGELVPYRSIGDVRVVSPQNITVTSTFTESRYTNGELRLTYGYSNNNIYGPGANDFISCIMVGDMQRGGNSTFSGNIEFI